jgi:hypothetical protein
LFVLAAGGWLATRSATAVRVIDLVDENVAVKPDKQSPDKQSKEE